MMQKLPTLSFGGLELEVDVGLSAGWEEQGEPGDVGRPGGGTEKGSFSAQTKVSRKLGCN